MLDVRAQQQITNSLIRLEDGPARYPVGHGRLSDRSHAGLWIELALQLPSSPIRSDWYCPADTPDHPAMMSYSASTP